jgi:hypothetical protein
MTVNGEGEKGYSLKMEYGDPYLRVTVSGARVTPRIALDYWREIIDECDRLDCNRILLDHDFAEMISMQEMIEVIGPVTEMLKGRIMAFYDRYGHYEIPEAGKMIMRASNVKMQIFHDPDRAERWLLAN